MTEDSVAANDLATVVRRRLTGLLVLLILVFGLSLLTRIGSPRVTEAIQTVVIPLSATTALPAALPEATTAELPGSEPSPSMPVQQEAVKNPIEPKPKSELVASDPVTSHQTVTPPRPHAPHGSSVLGKPKTEAPTLPKPISKKVEKPDATKPIASAVPHRWFVVVGAFKDPLTAQAIGARIKLAGFKTDTQAVNMGKEHLIRVQAGPFNSRSEAETARATLIVEGLTKAAVTTEK